jgi:hypothetical protein
LRSQHEHDKWKQEAAEAFLAHDGHKVQVCPKPPTLSRNGTAVLG